MRELRKDTPEFEDEAMPYASERVTIIRRRHNEYLYTNRVGEKRDLLADIQHDDEFVAVWTGSYRSDAFVCELDKLAASLGVSHA
jgi:hypothetical protein